MTFKRLLTISVTMLLIASQINAQNYLSLRQDGKIYDVDVVVFARQLSQPSADTVHNKASVKNHEVVTLPVWDGSQELFQYPEVAAPPADSVPIDNRADPVQVLSDVILSTDMNHAIVNRLKVNPTYRPIYHQKWRQLPSAFRNPRYIEVSNLSQSNQNFNNQLTNRVNGNNEVGEIDENQLNTNDMPIEFAFNGQAPDFSIDGQVAFSSQAYNHLHVKMNLFRVDSVGKQIVYELSQQKRISLNQWQYFDHQQFGVLAKVTAVTLRKGE